MRASGALKAVADEKITCRGRNRISADSAESSLHAAFSFLPDSIQTFLAGNVKQIELDLS
jgi:hypothetical protein